MNIMANINTSQSLIDFFAKQYYEDANTAGQEEIENVPRKKRRHWEAN